MKRFTKEDIKRIEDRLRKRKKNKIKKTKIKESTAEDTSIKIQEGEESIWQFSDFGTISVYPTKGDNE